MGTINKEKQKIMRAFAFAAYAATALGIKLQVQEKSDLYGEDALYDVIDSAMEFDFNGDGELSLDEYLEMLASLDDDLWLDDTETAVATDYYNMLEDGI